MIGPIDESAQRVSISPSAIQRWRSRFAETGLLKRHGWKGHMSVDPKIAVRMDKDGRPIKAAKKKREDVFAF